MGRIGIGIKGSRKQGISVEGARKKRVATLSSIAGFPMGGGARVAVQKAPQVVGNPWQGFYVWGELKSTSSVRSYVRMEYVTRFKPTQSTEWRKTYLVDSYECYRAIDAIKVAQKPLTNEYFIGNIDPKAGFSTVDPESAGVGNPSSPTKITYTSRQTVVQSSATYRVGLAFVVGETNRTEPYDVIVYYTARGSSADISTTATGGYCAPYINGSQALIDSSITDPTGSLGVKAFNTKSTTTDNLYAQSVKIASGLTGRNVITLLTVRNPAYTGNQYNSIEAVAISADIGVGGVKTFDNLTVGANNYSLGNGSFYAGTMPPDWQPNTAYVKGSEVFCNGYFFHASVAGTSSSTPPVAAGLDGTVNWLRADETSYHCKKISGLNEYDSKKDYVGFYSYQDSDWLDVGGQSHPSTPVVWEANKAYTTNNEVTYNGLYFMLTTSGTSGNSGITYNASTDQWIDGSLIWVQIFKASETLNSRSIKVDGVEWSPTGSISMLCGAKIVVTQDVSIHHPLKQNLISQRIEATHRGALVHMDTTNTFNDNLKIGAWYGIMLPFWKKDKQGVSIITTLKTDLGNTYDLSSYPSNPNTSLGLSLSAVALGSRAGLNIAMGASISKRSVDNFSKNVQSFMYPHQTTSDYPLLEYAKIYDGLRSNSNNPEIITAGTMHKYNATWSFGVAA